MSRNVMWPGLLKDLLLPGGRRVKPGKQMNMWSSRICPGGINVSMPALLLSCLAAGLLLASCVSSSTLEMKVDELTETRQKLEKLRDEHSELKRKEASVRRERDSLEKELARTVKEKEILELKVEELDKRLTASGEEVLNLEKKVSTLKDELKDSRGSLSSQIDELISRAGRLQKENAELIERLDRQTERLSESERKARELGMAVEEQDKVISDLDVRLKEKQQKLSSLAKTHDSLVGELKEEIRQGQIEVASIRDRLTVKMVDKILFSSGSAVVNEKGAKVIGRVAKILKGVEDRRIMVEGHTDNVAISQRLADKYPSNWELSAARAIEVVKHLQKAGLDPTRLSAAGFGEYRPVASNDTPEQRAKNRRIEIVLLPLEQPEKGEEQTVTSEEKSSEKGGP